MQCVARLSQSSEPCSVLFFSRLFVVVMVGVAIAWIPVIKETSGGQVFIYINEVTNYLAPPFAAVFLLAVLVPRVNEKVPAGVLYLMRLPFVCLMTECFLCGKCFHHSA